MSNGERLAEQLDQLADLMETASKLVRSLAETAKEACTLKLDGKSLAKAIDGSLQEWKETHGKSLL